MSSTFQTKVKSGINDPMKKKTYIDPKTGKVLNSSGSTNKTLSLNEDEKIAKQAYRYKLYQELLAKYGSFENINKELIKRGKKPLKERPQPPVLYSGGGSIPILPPIPIPGIQIPPSQQQINVQNILNEIDELQNLENQIQPTSSSSAPRRTDAIDERERQRQEEMHRETERMRENIRSQEPTITRPTETEQIIQSIRPPPGTNISLKNKKGLIIELFSQLMRGQHGYIELDDRKINESINHFAGMIRLGQDTEFIGNLIGLLLTHNIDINDYRSSREGAKKIIEEITKSSDFAGFMNVFHTILAESEMTAYITQRAPPALQNIIEVAGEPVIEGYINISEPNFRGVITNELIRLGIPERAIEIWWTALVASIQEYAARDYGESGGDRNRFLLNQEMKRKLLLDNVDSVIQRAQEQMLPEYMLSSKNLKNLIDMIKNVLKGVSQVKTQVSTAGGMINLVNSLLNDPGLPEVNRILLIGSNTTAGTVKEAVEAMFNLEIPNRNLNAVELGNLRIEQIPREMVRIPGGPPDDPGDDYPGDDDPGDDEPDFGNDYIVEYNGRRRRLSNKVVAVIIFIVGGGIKGANEIINNIKNAKKNNDNNIPSISSGDMPTPPENTEIPIGTRDGPTRPITQSYLPNSILNYVDIKDYTAELNKINAILADPKTSGLTKQYMEKQKIDITRFIDKEMPNAGAYKMSNIPPQLLDPISIKSGILQKVELTPELERLGQTDNIEKYNELVDKLNKMSGDTSYTPQSFAERTELVKMINETREKIAAVGLEGQTNIEATKATKRKADMNIILEQRQKYEYSQTKYKSTAAQLKQLILQKAPNSMIDQLYIQMSEEKAKFANDKKAYDDSLKVYAYTDKFNTNLKNQTLEVPITNAQSAEKFNEIQQLEQAIISKSQTDPNLSELPDDYEILVRKIKMENPDNDAYIDKRLSMARDLYKSWVGGELPAITQIKMPELKDEETTIEGDDIDAVVKKIDENIDVRLTEGEGTLQADIYDPAEAKLFLSDDAEAKKQRESFFEYSKVQPGNGLGSMRDNVLRQHNARVYTQVQYPHKLGDAPIFNPTLGREYGNPLLQTNYTKGNPEIKQLINRAELSRANTQAARNRQPFMIPDIQSQHGKVQYEHDGPMQSIAQDRIFKPFGIPDKATTTNYLRNESYYSPEYHLAQYTAKPTTISEIRNNGFDMGLRGFKPSTSGNIIEYTPQKFTNFNFGLIQDGANPTRRQSQTSFQKPANIDIGMAVIPKNLNILTAKKNYSYSDIGRGQFTVSAR